MDLKNINIDITNVKTKIIYIILTFITLFGVFYFGRNYNASKHEYVIWVCLMGAMLFLLALYYFVKIQFYKYVFIFFVLLGSITLFVQPILNVPDEVAHFARAELMSRGEVCISPDEEMHTTIQSIVDLGNDYSKTYLQSEVKGEEIDYTWTDIPHVAASNLPLMYIPQTMGIVLAKLLRLDVIWLLWLARFFNMLFYSICCSLAIKIAPKLQMLIFFVAALPMSMQQAASCSPDVMINGMAFLLVAMFLRLYCKKQESISGKEESIFFALSFISTLSKVTNIFLAGLILLVPCAKFKSKKRAYIIKISLVVSVTIVAGAYYLYTTTFVPNLEQAAYLQSIGADSAGQIHYILGNFRDWFQDFGAALIYQASEYISSLNFYGWIEYSYPILTPIMLVLFGKMCCQEQGLGLKMFDKFLIFLMVGGIYFSTCFELYLSWSPVGSASIGGVQGRYFIPLICLLFLLFSTEKNDREVSKKVHLLDVTFIVGIACAMISIMTVNYY